MTDRLPWQIAGAAAVLRIAVAVAAAAVAGSDTLHVAGTEAWLAPAREWLDTGRFVRGGEPEILQPPGYPLLLLTGLAAGPVEAVTVALQAALAAVTVLAVFALAQQLFSRRAAVLAASLCALEPLSVLYGGQLTSETQLTACLTAGLALLVRALAGPQPTVPAAAGAGLLLAAATLTHPGAYPVALFAAFCLGWSAASQAPDRRRWAAVAALVVLGLGPPLAWQIRNTATVGYTRLAAVVDTHTYFVHGAATTAAVDGVPLHARQAQLGYGDWDAYLQQHPGQRAWTPAERYEWMGREGLRAVWAQPLTSLRIYLAGLLRVALHPGGIDSLRLFGALDDTVAKRVADDGLTAALLERPGLLGVEVMFGLALLSLYGLAVLGAGAVPAPQRVAAVVCWAVAAYLLVGSGGPQAAARARHPIMPLVCLFAGAGLASRQVDPGAGSHRPR